LCGLACSAIFFEALISRSSIFATVDGLGTGHALATAQWVQTLYLLSFGGFLLLGEGFATMRAAGSSSWRDGVVRLWHRRWVYFSQQFWTLLPQGLVRASGRRWRCRRDLAIVAIFSAGEQQRTAFGIFGAFAAVGLRRAGAWRNDRHPFRLALDLRINIPIIAIVLWAGSRWIQRRQASPVSLRTGGWRRGSL